MTPTTKHDTDRYNHISKHIFRAVFSGNDFPEAVFAPALPLLYCKADTQDGVFTEHEYRNFIAFLRAIGSTAFISSGELRPHDPYVNRADAWDTFGIETPFDRFNAYQSTPGEIHRLYDETRLWGIANVGLDYYFLGLSPEVAAVYDKHPFFIQYTYTFAELCEELEDTSAQFQAAFKAAYTDLQP